MAAPDWPVVSLWTPCATGHHHSHLVVYTSRALWPPRRVAARVSGLPATFTCAPSPTVPFVTASVAVSPSSLELAWQPSWRPSRVARRPSQHASGRLTCRRKILDSINTMTCKCRATSLFIAVPLRSATSPRDHPTPRYADAYRLLPLSLLPNLKNRIGNLQYCALAGTDTTPLEQDSRCHCQSQECQ